jgi:hypothetical protein
MITHYLVGIILIALVIVFIIQAYKYTQTYFRDVKNIAQAAYAEAQNIKHDPSGGGKLIILIVIIVAAIIAFFTI